LSLRRRSRYDWTLVAAAVVAAVLAGGAAADRAAPRASLPLVFGWSVRHRPLQAIEVGDVRSRVKAVVVGCIDGNEPAGLAIVRALERRTPKGIDLWLVPDMNPDGVAAGTLQNGHEVDLNRNFPWHWRPLGSPGYWQYSGPRPLSEPESRAVYSLLLRLRPSLVIWYHQPLGLVDESGGDVPLERRYARLVGLPFVRLPRYPGSATSWANRRLPGATSFVVELPAGPLSPTAVSAHANAVLALARSLR
jgi:protein MpaA